MRLSRNADFRHPDPERREGEGSYLISIEILRPSDSEWRKVRHFATGPK